jgi:hypothetical protein
MLSAFKASALKETLLDEIINQLKSRYAIKSVITMLNA